VGSADGWILENLSGGLEVERDASMPWHSIAFNLLSVS
jgi:hypothetical protein